jgi:uncharacterized membrane protein
LRQARQEHADAFQALHEHLRGVQKAGINPPWHGPGDARGHSKIGLDGESLPVFGPAEEEV